MKSFFFPSIALSLSTMMLCQAQTVSNGRSNSESNKSNSITSNTGNEKAIPFSIEILETDNINPKYSGHKLKSVIESVDKKLKEIGSKKDFETTAEYNSRRATVFSRPFFGNLTSSDTFAFVWPVGSFYKYSPDSEKLEFFVSFDRISYDSIGSPSYEYGSKEARVTNFEEKTISDRSYKAGNAYGATVTVREIKKVVYGISINSYPAESRISLTMDTTKARRDLPNMQALLLFRISEPYMVYDFTRSEPTYQNPRDYWWSKRYLHGDILGIIFYSGVTGDVIARIPSEFGKPKPESGLNPNLQTSLTSKE